MLESGKHTSRTPLASTDATKPFITNHKKYDSLPGKLEELHHGPLRQAQCQGDNPHAPVQLVTDHSWPKSCNNQRTLYTHDIPHLSITVKNFNFK